MSDRYREVLSQVTLRLRPAVPVKSAPDELWEAIPAANTAGAGVEPAHPVKGLNR